MLYVILRGEFLNTICMKQVSKRIVLKRIEEKEWFWMEWEESIYSTSLVQVAFNSYTILSFLNSF